MSSAIAFVCVGLLLLVMGLTSTAIRRLPVTTAMIYLAVGIVVGPTALNLLHFNPLQQSGFLEIATEIAVLLSLFTAGMKMPVPVSVRRWQTPVLLAFASMSLTVALITVFGYHLLGLPLGAAVLLGAILAPTDPVLATDIQVRHPGDRDRLRFNVTCEAGMNDGTAFPFVMLGLGLLGLHDLGHYGSEWILRDLLWATAAAGVIGIASGAALAHVAWRLRGVDEQHHRLDDFLGLGLIAMVYGASLMVHAWGFLAVFFAAVALRQTELRLTGRCPDRLQLQNGTDDEAPARTPPRRISESSLAFKEQLERLSEVVLILLVGCTLFVDSWSLRAIATAAFLFIVVRPASVLALLSRSRSPMRIRLLTGWFGIRGIGSLYYLMYAIEHGLPQDIALELLHITLVVVTLSIMIHGLSIRPLMDRYARR
ncbi:MAG: cation:proton antiporter [Algiphilus sp.]|uniref:cation:proton antiporter n=1 Tax=Algiphilus sp. TaxID=1872431 RepID=UPI0032EB8947